MNLSRFLAVPCVLALAACPSTTTGTRTDSRGVISGRVQLAAVEGASDLSRVRVDLGRGEGGVPVEADGSFTLSDLEPDVYTVNITYTGGLRDSAAGSAYAPWSTRVVLRAGSSTGLGVIPLQLGRGTVTGRFTRGDGGTLSGLAVKLIGAGSTIERAGTDGAFTFTDVEVGRWQLFAALPGTTGACGAEVVVDADGAMINLVDQPLTAATLDVQPATESALLARDGERWFLSGTEVTVQLVGGGAALARAWLEGNTPPAFGAPGAGFTFSGLAVDTATRMFVEAVDACGGTLPALQRTLVVDRTPPLADARLAGGAAFITDTTVQLDLNASDALSAPLDLRMVTCDGLPDSASCMAASAASAAPVPLQPLVAVTFADMDGARTVKLRVSDRSNNHVDLVRSTVLDRAAPADLVVRVDGQAPPATVYARTVTVEVASLDAVEQRVGLDPALAGTPWGLLDGQPVFLDLGTDNGAATFHVQLRDEAGNTSGITPFTVTVSNQAAVAGTLLLEGITAPLPPATIRLDAAGMATISGTSGVDGAFSVPAPTGTYNITVSAAGFRDLRLFGVPVRAPQVTQLGTLSLAAAGGRITGRVVLDGQPAAAHGDATVRLFADDGTTVLRTTTSDAGGGFVFVVPPGTYNGPIRAAARRFADGVRTGAKVVLQDQDFAVGDVFLAAVANDLAGSAQVEGLADHSGITVLLEGEAGSTTGQSRTATTDASGNYRVEDLPLGTWRVTLSRPSMQGLEVARRSGILVEKGSPALVPLVVLRQRFITINGGDAYTRDPNATLTLGVSVCHTMQVSSTPDFSAPEYDGPCEATRPWTFPGDGEHVVYARFTSERDGAFTPAVSDSIIVDTVAGLSAFDFTPTGTLTTGSEVVFTAVTTGERGGSVTVSVDGYVDGLLLRDDGRAPDAAAGDGTYTLRWRVNDPRDVSAARVVATYVDAAGNSASMDAPQGMMVGVPPLIRDIRVGVDTVAGRTTLSWSTDEDTTGSVLVGAAPITGESQPGVEALPSADTGTRHQVVVSSLDGAPLVTGTTYHFVIRATDGLGNAISTPDRTWLMRPNTPQQVAAIPGDNRAWVRWEGGSTRGIRGYHVYRASNAAGPFTRLTTAPYNHEALVYEDPTSTNGTTWHYRVTAEDDAGNESPPSTTSAAQPGGNTTGGAGTRIVGGAASNAVLTGVHVWSSRGSPYIITADINVRPGALLVVGPGTEVRFERADVNAGDNARYIRVEGRIAVIGGRGTTSAGGTFGTTETDDGMVRLCSHAPDAAAADWSGIYISGTSPDGSMDFERDTARYVAGNLFYRAWFQHAGGMGGAAVVNNRYAVAQTRYDELGRPDGMLAVLRSRFTDLPFGVQATVDQVLVRDVELVGVCTVAGHYCSGDQALDLRARDALLEKVAVRDTMNAVNLLGPGSNVAPQPGQPAGLFDSYLLAARVNVTGAWRGLYVAGDVHVVDALLENTDGAATVQGDHNPQRPGGSSVARSTIRNSLQGATGMAVADCVLEGMTTTAAEQCDVVQSVFRGNGCVEGTSCTGYESDVSYPQGLRASTFESGPRTRRAMLSMMNTGAIPVEFNHFTGALNGMPAWELGVENATGTSPLLRGNSLLMPVMPGDVLLLSNGLYNPDVVLDVTGNHWGALTTAEMSAGASNISTIVDFQDNTNWTPVDFSGFAPQAFPLPRITSPWWGQRFLEGDTITFRGSATDPEDGNVPGTSMTWLNNGVENLGSGAEVTSTTVLPGFHVAWLLVTDSGGQEARVPVAYQVWPRY